MDRTLSFHSFLEHSGSQMLSRDDWWLCRPNFDGCQPGDAHKSAYPTILLGIQIGLRTEENHHATGGLSNCLLGLNVPKSLSGTACSSVVMVCHSFLIAPDMPRAQSSRRVASQLSLHAECSY